MNDYNSQISTKKTYNYLFKLLVIGDSCTGKTDLIRRLQGEEQYYSNNFMPTVGIDFQIKTIELNGEVVKVQIWDTAGQERFKSISRAYYRGACGIIIVYDVTNLDTFRNVFDWLRDINNYAPEGVSKLLLGNKADQTAKRVVSTEEGKKLADELNIPFVEISENDNTNVQQAFLTIASEMKKRAKTNRAVGNDRLESAGAAGPSSGVTLHFGLSKPIQQSSTRQCC